MDLQALHVTGPQGVARDEHSMVQGQIQPEHLSNLLAFSQIHGLQTHAVTGERHQRDPIRTDPVQDRRDDFVNDEERGLVDKGRRNVQLSLGVGA